MIKFQCNCKEKWSETCKTRSTDWLEQYDELEMYPIQYHLYYKEYRTRGIISDTKNDEKLYNYLKIAYKLVLKDDKYGIYREEENIDSMLDYLNWS